MISLSPVASASGAAGYYTTDNYYTDDQATAASEWVGQGAEELGLRGEVDAEIFTQVLDGDLPDGSVIDARNGERRPGLDLTFSASKSVSLIALVGGDKRVVQAFRQAVSATLKWTEKNLIEARVKDGKGQKPEATKRMVAATFLHDVNRNGEPQLHVHAVIVNATKATDGKWHAVHNDALYNHQHAIGAVFNAELRARIEALGYETVAAKNPVDGAFEIAGVDRSIVEAFSTRRAEVLAALDNDGRGSPRERELAALATRKGKDVTLDPSSRQESWKAMAAATGFNPGPLIAGAEHRATQRETMWSKIVEGARGAGREGMAIAAAMGLTPRDGDPLVPERFGHLDPARYAAAQAVASAARHLGEREAAFDRIELITVALQRRGPITVDSIESRIDLLVEKGLLFASGTDRMMTTEQAVVAERAVQQERAAGQGRGIVILDDVEAAVRVQAAARALGLRRLNPGQEGAARAMLSSRDRVVLVQGAAGTGKSAALAPVVAIAQAQGVNVIGLATANQMVRDLGEKTGAESRTLHSFLNHHERALEGRARPPAIVETQRALKGAMLIVDESSTLGTDQMLRLLRIANRFEVGRIVFAGDTGQLAAISAGKPFVQSQQRAPTEQVTENLRAKSPVMKEVNRVLVDGDMRAAFAALKPHTREVPRDKLAESAAKLWASLPRDERDKTLLLASGRAVRAAANRAAQSEMRKQGELVGRGVTMTILDRVNATREQTRSADSYQEGQRIKFHTDLPSQGLRRGSEARVTGVRDGKVDLAMDRGGTHVLRPDKLPRNGRHDAVSIYTPRDVTLHTGDRIRWTANDRAHGLLNADLGRIESITRDTVKIASLRDGEINKLKRDDPMLRHLDLAYAINVHVAQGVTAEHGIVMMSAAERRLASTKLFLVAMTRIVDRPTLVIDSGPKLERMVIRNHGEKTAALDVVHERPPPLPERYKGLEL